MTNSNLKVEREHFDINEVVVRLFKPTMESKGHHFSPKRYSPGMLDLSLTIE